MWASIVGDKVCLDGTTLEEVEEYHRDTLKLALRETNQIIAEYEEKKRCEEEREKQRIEEHERTIRDQAHRISFDD